MTQPNLAAALQAASVELAALSLETDGLGVADSTAVDRWQALDRISQHLAELAAFLSAVSTLVPDVRADLRPALAALRVGAVAARLQAQPIQDAADPGSIELFDA